MVLKLTRSWTLKIKILAARAHSWEQKNEISSEGVFMILDKSKPNYLHVKYLQELVTLRGYSIP